MTNNNLLIVGTSHIAEHSLKNIEEAFHKFKPDIVAVELDRSRLDSLLSKQKPSYSPKIIKEIGFKGYLFAVIGGFVQQKLGSVVGVRPGSDMLRAVELARDNSKRIALIDRDIRVTLSRLSKAITWRDKWHFFVDIFKAPFSEKMKIDLRRVPEKKVISKLMGILKTRYPGIYLALVEERNKFMALKLRGILENHPDKRVLVVVGAGHEDELLELVKAGTAARPASS